MKSIDRLVAEHDIIERGLSILEKVVLRIESRQSVAADFPKWAPQFFRQFADQCHHAKEEDLYGYGDGAPTVQTSAKRMPRRSSLKNPNACPRRASIGYTGEVNLVLPAGMTAKKRTSVSFAENDSVGRYMVASRDIKPLEVQYSIHKHSGIFPAF